MTYETKRAILNLCIDTLVLNIQRTGSERSKQLLARAKADLIILDALEA